MSWSVECDASVGELQLQVKLSQPQGPLAVVGPNGSGKTTLLRVIAGVHSPRRGTITIADAVVFDAKAKVDVPTEQRRIGYVPQGYGLFPHLCVADNVAFGLPRTASREERRAMARSILDELECSQLADRDPRSLSGGEQQRVALARALVVQPQLLLLDEPMAALDASARRRVRRFVVRKIQSLRCPSIVVTHDVRDVAALDAEVCVLEGGRITQSGRLEELRAAPATEFVAEFVDAGSPEPAGASAGS